MPGRPSANTQPLYGFFLVRPLLGRPVGLALDRARPDRCRGGHGAARLRDRRAMIASRGVGVVAARHRDAAPVPRLARRPRQPRGARRAARGGSHARRARRRRAAHAAVRPPWPARSPGSPCSATHGSSSCRSCWRCSSRGTFGRSRRAALAAAVLVGVAALVVTSRGSSATRPPSVASTLTTDARALWKANNLATYDILAARQVDRPGPELPGRAAVARARGRHHRAHADRVVTVDECAQMRLLPARR